MNESLAMSPTVQKRKHLCRLTTPGECHQNQ